MRSAKLRRFDDKPAQSNPPLACACAWSVLDKSGSRGKAPRRIADAIASADWSQR